MTKLISLILALTVLFSSVFFIFSCAGPTPPENPPVSDSKDDEQNGGAAEDGDKDDGPESDETAITVPPYKDYGRGSVDFDDIVYTRPDCEAIIESVAAVTDLIEKNEASFDSQLSAVSELEEPFNRFLTMYSYANIMNSKDASIELWVDEFKYISESYPLFSQNVEKLMVAAAGSAHAEKFEEEYFGEGLIEKYADGGKYTDRLVALMQEESRLESEYSSLSTANVQITYKTFTDDTFDNIMLFYEQNYGTDSVSYKTAYKECLMLYEKKVGEISAELLVELFKVRRQISDELGYDSYATLAYEEIYHDYSEADMLQFILDVKSYVIPVYVTLESLIFEDFFKSYTQENEPTRVELINGTYSILSEIDPEAQEIFAYMLQHGLYDIEKSSNNRFDGSFATYLDKYSAPYLFVSTEGSVGDYMTLGHEFGHFMDSFYNYGESTSLDLSEVSSMGFEWIMLDALKSEISQNEYKYLAYKKYRSAMETFIYQGFYALFEHYAYQLEDGHINEHNLTMALTKAANDIGLNSSVINSLEMVIIPHIMLYPFYVQSYCISEAVALDINFMEDGKDGEGYAAYKALIVRKKSDLTFTEYLIDAGISSPFERGYVRKMADAIHYHILGSHCYPENSDSNIHV